MPDSLEDNAATTLTQALERIRTRLHEVEIGAPPQIYQAIERLKEITHDSLTETEQRISHLAHELGEEEEDLIEWLKLDLRAVESRLLQSLLNTTDESRVELGRWLKTQEKDTD